MERLLNKKVYNMEIKTKDEIVLKVLKKMD